MPAIPHPTEGQDVSDVTVASNQLANFSIFAPGIARSRFTRVGAEGALITGLSIGAQPRSRPRN